MKNKYEEIRKDAVIVLIGKIIEVAENCPDAETSERLIDALVEYNEKRWSVNCG